MTTNTCTNLAPRSRPFGAHARRSPRLFLALATAAMALQPGLNASISYGSLNNFDVVNDTGGKCYGFEIEIDDAHTTSVTYTYDYNHYGVPAITEDTTDPAHPKVFVRYASKKNPDGSYASFTNPQDPLNPLGPTGGHAFTNPGVNLGGEHFGVGYYGNTTVKYHWLVDDPLHPGTLILGPVVNVATPVFNYVPPVAAAPGVPAQPPVVQVVIPPPPPEVPEINAVEQYGPPVWVKILKTTQPSGKHVGLDELLPQDPENPGTNNWAGAEAPETEVEWQVFQKRPPGDARGEGDIAGDDKLPEPDRAVTRRYEFYTYQGDLDPETGEALCSDTNSCPNAVGNFIGAQMAGFNVMPPLGLVARIQDGLLNQAYPDRLLVAGGNTPYAVSIASGVLPAGLNLDPVTGVLSGTPTEAGVFHFTVIAADADRAHATNAYSLDIQTGAALVEPITVTRGGFRYNRAHKRFVQSVVLKNNTASAYAGPIALVLDGLGANATLWGANGVTAAAAPAGSPYVNVDVGGEGLFRIGQSATVILEFANPTFKGISYGTRVLVGDGAR